MRDDVVADQARGDRRSLQELFARLDEADDPRKAFLDQILEGAATRDPELPNVLRAGAIPRSLDPKIVGVLRGAPGDTEENIRLFDLLLTYRFVLSRPDGGYVYHDNTRDALLTDWKSSDAKRAKFVEINQSLAAFHEEKYAESMRADRYLNEVSTLIAKVNPERLRRLTRVIEATMRTTLLEALYHHLEASANEGVDFFQTSFYKLEEDSRFGICESLISFVRDFLLRLLPGEFDQVLLAWLDYFDARLTQRIPPYDYARAEGVLRRLLASDQLPPDLRIWALDELSSAYAAQLKLGSALRTRTELIEQEPGVDVYNEPLNHSSLGNLYWWLGDYLSAVPQLKLAIEKVDALPGARGDTGILARLDLSAVFSELGDWPGAYETALEAMRRARMLLPHDVIVQRQVAMRFAQLLSTFNLRASDCAAAECLALAESRTIQRFDTLIDRVDLLLETGRIHTARALVDQITRELDGGDRDWRRVHLASRVAWLLDREGRESEAEAVYSTLLDETADEPGFRSLHISARGNRGWIKAVLGHSAGALADLTEARNEWAGHGANILAAGIAVRRADVLIRIGDLTGARKVLDEIEPVLPAGTNSTRGDFLRSRGDLHERLGDWSAAQDNYEQALHIETARRSAVGQMSLLSKLALVHSNRTQWAVAAEYHRRAADVITKLANADTDADGHGRRVDQANAEGLRRFCEEKGRRAALDRARQLFRSAAELEPENPWPLLNLCFAYAEQQDWEGAIEAVKQVLSVCPAPMRAPRLYLALGDYVRRYAEQLRRRNRPRRAADAVADALEHLSAALPPAELAQVYAVHGTLLALAGDGTAAQDAYHTALSIAGGPGAGVAPAIGESISGLVDSVDDLWTVHAALPTDQDPAVALRDTAATVRTTLGLRLDELLELGPDPFAEMFPFLSPTVVEVGDALVPIVDSRQDTGRFLFELLPAMRERIRTNCGVNVPGVRMRGSAVLAPIAYSIQVGEVPVAAAALDPAASFVIRPASGDSPYPRQNLTDTHPLTGAAGLWFVEPSADNQPDDAAVLTAAEYLVHQIERVIRTHLVRYLGVQETSLLVDTWRDDDHSGLVGSVLPDEDARLRLTWVLQGLVDAAVPITNWPVILTAIQDAGGITAPVHILQRAVRARLRDQLPGARTGRRSVPVPAEYQEALLGRTENPTETTSVSPTHEFRRWLQAIVTTSGPAITLVVGTDEARELVDMLAHAEDRLITVLTRDEMSPDDH